MCLKNDNTVLNKVEQCVRGRCPKKEKKGDQVSERFQYTEPYCKGKHEGWRGQVILYSVKYRVIKRSGWCSFNME